MCRLLPLCALALLAGCESVDRVNRPLPEKLALRALDGSRMERVAFLGRTWVLCPWLPG